VKENPPALATSSLQDVGFEGRDFVRRACGLGSKQLESDLLRGNYFVWGRDGVVGFITVREVHKASVH
jgi:hypothetical protein